MRPIDADKLCEDLLTRWSIADEKQEQAVREIMANVVTPIVVSQPTITADRPTGEWILDPNGMDWNLPAWRCSRCGAKNDNIGVVAKGIASDPYRWAGSKFCPQCGCKMVAKENSDDR